MTSRKTKNQLYRNGLTQAGRYLRQLDPTYAALDDRSMSDCLAFGWRLAEHINYYTAVETGAGSELVKDGNWQQVLKFGNIFQQALIASASIDDWRATLTVAHAQYDETNAMNDLLAYYDAMLDMAGEVMHWQNLVPAGSATRASIHYYVDQQFRQLLSDLIARFDELVALKGYTPARHPRNRIDRDFHDWDVLSVPAAPFVFGDGDDHNKLVELKYELSLIMSQMLEAFAGITNDAERLLHEELQRKDHEGHVGLFLAFLRLFEQSRADLNNLTSRHLDFYLRDFLQLTPRAPEPDRAHLLFTPNKGQEQVELTAGTQLKAGKDSQKKELVYELEHDLVVNRAKIDSLKNVYCDLLATGGVNRIHAGATANSTDGMGTPLPEENGKWSAFGNDGYPGAGVGFAVTSPLLRLTEGTRKIAIWINLANAPGTAIRNRLSKAQQSLLHQTNAVLRLPDLFTLSFSGKKAWLPITSAIDLIKNDKSYQLRIVAVADPTFEPIMDYNPDVLGAGNPLDTKFPVARLCANWAGLGRTYSALADLKIADIDLQVDVNDIQNIIIRNNDSRLKPGKPFLPFGGSPLPGAAFYIGHQETFAKKLSEIRVNWDWVNAPNNLSQYYNQYSSGTIEFTARVDLLNDYEWKTEMERFELSPASDVEAAKALETATEAEAEALTEVVKLIDRKDLLRLTPEEILKKYESKLTPAQQKMLLELLRTAKHRADRKKRRPGDSSDIFSETLPTGGNQAPADVLNDLTLSISNYQAAPDAPNFKDFDIGLRRGGIRLVLTSPDFGFGHAAFPQLYAQVVTDNMLGVKRTPVPDKPGEFTTEIAAQPTPLPNRPYTPEFDRLRLGYTASARISAESDSRFCHLHPFGHEWTGNSNLLPSFPEEGSLYIGVTDLVPAQQLAILFQFAEGSGDPFSDRPSEPTWAYLTDDGWESFKKPEIVRDGTNGFLQSGITVFSVPKSATTTNTQMPRGLHWIRVTVSKNTAAVHDLLAIHAQAGTAVFRDNNNAADHLRTVLSTGSIAKLKQSNASIKSIAQPYASYGGRPPENERHFATRSSERLRHKDRAVTVWDYERLVLEEFSDLHKVRVLNHTAELDGITPGHVSIVVVPDLQNQNNPYPLRPAVAQSRLVDVENFLRKRMSAFVELHVSNPFYEGIEAAGTVYFRHGLDEGLHQQKLQQDITRMLTPWLYGAEEVTFAGRVHRSVVLNLIEELPYVDFIEDFQLLHHVPGQDEEEAKEELVAVSPKSILVSHDQHRIVGVGQ